MNWYTTSQTNSHTDSVYRNQNDTIRFRIFKRTGLSYRGNQGWDADIFSKNGDFKTLCVDGAISNYKTKREIKTVLENEYGTLILINKVDNILEGW